ncbi:hypothetical protein GGR57DRAFT_303608 [Xylariaceae sp. FL1272]|nr:hypothetical protein GGR57DRAFT_303608 [Xylariaceae sp. FL1272]
MSNASESSSNIPSASEDRKPSAGGMSGPGFDNLIAQKRDSNDAATEAKRESLAEQKPQGMIGKMMQNYVSGSDSSSNAGKQ